MIPYAFDHSAYAAELHQRFDDLEAGQETSEVVAVAGRVMLLRPHGQLAFAELRDSSGSIQLFAQDGETEGFEEFSKLHQGDWVGATGRVIKTRRGELSVKVAGYVVLAVARHNFGEKWAGISDPDLRYRHREADLWANPESRTRLARRSAIVRAMRERLWAAGFVEVETPVLGTVASGATARPFTTHHNAYDANFDLRIAPELWLKRLVVGGFERVFEMARVFRNEGVDGRHNPEFTMLEVYAAYWDGAAMMELTEELTAGVASDVLGTTDLVYQGRAMPLAPPWPRRTMAEVVSEAISQEVSVHSPRALLAALAAERGVEVHEAWGTGRLLSELFEVTAESELFTPTFVTEYPIEISPLSRPHRNDDRLTERFEAFAAGRELANGFTELIDPDDQRKRFEEQARLKAAGEDETLAIDDDYIRALEWGLPPTGGLGIGVDRLVMILTDAPNIREVIAFPTLRPRRD